jgi:NAD(P)-dependent dehydrogenase (short-subunit alcohol dehydrogenase family)
METQTLTMDPGAFVVIGATGGIGSALTRRLVGHGHRVLAAGRDTERLELLAAETGAKSFVLDARRASDVRASLAAAIDQFGRLDGVANCVGSLLLKPAHLTSDEEFAYTIATNLGSAFATVQAAARLMKRGGSVVLVSSAAARLGLPHHEAIAAAKAGIIGLVLSAAATYASHGLRINCVAPGLVDTPLTARITGNAQAAKASIAMHALGRFGRPEEVASAIEWFLGSEQSWVTGQVLGVDGGLAGVRTRPAAASTAA